MARYLDIVFPLPIQKRFCYKGGEDAVVGKRALTSFGRRDVTGFIVAERDALPDGVNEASIKEIRRVVDKETLFGEAEITLASWMASFYIASEGEALQAMLPQGRRAKALSEFGTEGVEGREDSGALSLSAEQENALNAITSGEKGPFYLYGITGSGKTEVFLRAAEYFTSRGKSVLYLVPEIALSRQTVEYMKARFGGLVCTLHSGLTGSEKLHLWQKIQAGDVKIVVGPRSAVFAPCKDLALVIIDEEHDGSYKSGSAPRYHARQVAMKRAALSGAILVMGSATPSAESFKLMRDGALKKLTLTKRLAGGGTPQVQIVDLSGNEGCLSPVLRGEIEKTAALKRQTILFLNRRGFSYFYHCYSCGFELRCRHCSVSLTYHKGLDKALCHYCGYKTPVPRACPKCGSYDAGFAGFGTEMVEEEVRRAFPHLRVSRVDADNAADAEKTLALFKAGFIDILLGTQMVAKGLNFPGVRLVGVILADTALHLPDFRAKERTFSLLVQVAGRAGRYFPDGKVIVQTYRPLDGAIKKAAALDVDGFFEEELAARNEQKFPPYSRVVRFVIRGRILSKVEAEIARLAGIASRLLPRNAEMLGPAPCPISLHADNHRMQLILRSPDIGTLHAASAKTAAAFNEKKDAGVYLEADVDPVSML